MKVLQSPRNILSIPGRSLLFLVASLSLAACGSGSSEDNGPQGAVGTDTSVAAKASVIKTGDPDCTEGGILVETGIDENRNGVLDASEVDASEKVCNGTSGANGTDGNNGLNALVKISTEAAGGHCTHGGKRIDSGLDLDSNGRLDAPETSSTDYICNGAPGVDGINGTDGSDGLNALIDMNPEPVSANCPNGGLRIDVGIDTNGNGSLDPAEITQTGFVCSGNDANGSIGWQTATLIESGFTGAAFYPQVAINADGDAMAVWSQASGTKKSIWANRYTVQAGWEVVELIETGNRGDALSPQIALDAAGNAVAIWQQSNGSHYDIWANRYVVGVGWSKVQRINTENSGNANLPQLSMDAQGNTTAVWYQHNGTRNNIWANRYVPGRGWGTAELIESNDAGGAKHPKISVEDSGAVIAVWEQVHDKTARSSIWANQYIPGSGWGTAELIETDDAGDATFPQISVRGGIAMAVWLQSDGKVTNTWASRYAVNSGWGKPEPIASQSSGQPNYPQVAAGNGSALAVWHQSNGTRSDIWSNRYVAGSGWGKPELIESNDTGTARFPQVAANTDGNALAVWPQESARGKIDIWANRYVPGIGWGTAELVETRNAGSANLPQLSLNNNGTAVTVWLQSDGSRDSVWANHWLAR
ncbi:hypothetical protein MNBD_GAMMA20-2441 [hydrothermal vent metagenome]|uniref:DUF7151 domain-containing protein n=1 Tax=hydrothermal vent metagenome TaxID=652676 RepID=A0A3B1B8W1_9ZZZZ